MDGQMLHNPIDSAEHVSQKENSFSDAQEDYSEYDTEEKRIHSFKQLQLNQQINSDHVKRLASNWIYYKDDQLCCSKCGRKRKIDNTEKTIKCCQENFISYCINSSTTWTNICPPNPPRLTPEDGAVERRRLPSNDSIVHDSDIDTVPIQPSVGDISSSQLSQLSAQSSSKQSSVQGRSVLIKHSYKFHNSEESHDIHVSSTDPTSGPLSQEEPVVSHVSSTDPTSATLENSRRTSNEEISIKQSVSTSLVQRISATDLPELSGEFLGNQSSTMLTPYTPQSLEYEETLVKLPVETTDQLEPSSHLQYDTDRYAVDSIEEQTSYIQADVQAVHEVDNNVDGLSALGAVGINGQNLPPVVAHATSDDDFINLLTVGYNVISSYIVVNSVQRRIERVFREPEFEPSQMYNHLAIANIHLRQPRYDVDGLSALGAVGINGQNLPPVVAQATSGHNPDNEVGPQTNENADIHFEYVHVRQPPESDDEDQPRNDSNLM